MYKCKNAVNPDFFGDLFTSHDLAYFSRNGNKIEQLIVNNKFFCMYAFRYEGVKIWNESPNHIKGAHDLNDFKGKSCKWSGQFCRCQNCILTSMPVV